MDELKARILEQLRSSLDRLARQLDDEPALAMALRRERDLVPAPARPRCPAKVRLPKLRLRELLYLALAHAELHHTRFDAIRLRADRAARLRRVRHLRLAVRREEAA